MAIGNKSNDNEQENENTEIFKRLEEFTKVFVETFEAKLFEFKKESAVGGSAKIGKQSDTAATVLGMSAGAGAGFVTGLPAVSATVSNIGKESFKYVFNQLTDHRGKAKRVFAVFRKLQKQELRRLIVEAAGDIFFCFQNQFTGVTTVENWERTMEKLAINAVHRSLNYIDKQEKKRKKNERKNKYNYKNIVEGIESNRDFITKGVIFGKSKITSFLGIFNPGHKIENQNGVQWNTSDLYKEIEIVEVKLNDQNISEYYIKTVSDKKVIDKYGYRLKFNWETCCEPNEYTECLVEYKIKITKDELMDQMEKILKILNKLDKEVLIETLDNNINTLTTKMDSVFAQLENTTKQDKRKTVWFDMKAPIRSFTGRIDELSKLHNSLQCEKGQVVVSQVASVIGLGGIGKSELARKYAYENRHYYSGNIIWIKAETQDSLNESFHRLAKELKIQLTENMDVQSIARDVYKYFEHTNSLFIFDNVENSCDVKEFLLLSASPDVEKPHVLITSRYQDWDMGEEGKVEVIRLDTFTVIEAKEFISKVLTDTNIQNSDEEITELAKVLHYFPLALAQATACIKENNKKLQIFDKQTYEISEYLNEYSQQKEKTALLNFKSKYRDDRYIETVYTTWNITFNKIKQNPDSLEIIEIMAYLAPDSINMNYLFSHLMNDNQEKLGKAVGVLCQYSMINLKKGISNIHRLVQEVIRLQLDEQGKTINVIRKALCILGPIINKLSVKEIDDSHITSVWHYASDYQELIEEYFFMCKYYNMKYTPLHLLAKAGYAESVQKILNNKNVKLNLKKVINAKNNDNETPLHSAARNGHLSVVKILKDLGKNTGKKACLIAAFHGHIDIVKCLNTDHQYDCCLLYAELYAALRSGNFVNLNSFINGLTEKQLKFIMEPNFEGVDKRFIREQWTPIYLAAYYGYLDIVKLLIDYKADINCSTLTGYTALHVAAANGHLEILKLLIENGANKNVINKSGRTILHAASKAGQLDIVKYLINNGILDDVNIPDKKGSTPLHTAAFYGKLKIVDFLLGNEIKNKANLNATDKYGTTPILAALFNCNTKIVDFLLKENDVNIYSTINIAHNGSRKMDFSVLHMAIAYDEVKMVAKLVEKADLNIIQQRLHENEDHKITAIHIAAYFNSSKVIKHFNRKNLIYDKNFKNIKKHSEENNRKPLPVSHPVFSSISHGVNFLCGTEKIIVSIIN